tara:strand:- start:135 stop:557 length:423 start_codon:yes stop_codon:yes gene_type:complete
MFKKQLVRDLLKDKTLDTDLVVVANTYQNISNDQLIEKLNLLNAFVNKKMFRYFQKYPDKRIMFICNIERVRNNTHSHMLLRIPKDYDRNLVLDLMSDYFQKLNKNFKLFREKARNQVGNIIYSTKKNGFNYNPDTLVVI